MAVAENLDRVMYDYYSQRSGLTNPLASLQDHMLAFFTNQNAGANSSSPAYAPAITPTVTKSIDQYVNVGVLTGNITINNPTITGGGSITPVDGQKLTFRFTQDATGTRTYTFGSAYVFGTDVPLANLPTTANASFEVTFEYVASSAKWRAVSLTRGF